MLYGADDGGAVRVILEKALSLGCTLFRTVREDIIVRKADVSGTLFDYKAWHDIKIGLLGLYQPKNAANVLLAVDVLRYRGFKISDEAVREGLLAARWPARFEIISEEPLIIFDGAHNPEGISVATESIAHYFRGEKVAVLSGVLRDKDYRFIAGELSTIADKAFTLTPDSPRALDGAEYAKILGECGVHATSYHDIKSALYAAYEYAKETSKPLVCLGSLYTYADVTAALEEIKSNEKR